MTITKYFVGGELEAFVRSSHASTTWSTDGGTYDSNFARGAVKLSRGDTTSYISIPLTSAQATCYASFQHYRSTPIAFAFGQPDSATWIYVVNASGTGLYRLQGVGGTAAQPLLQFQYNNAGTWAGIGNSMVVQTSALHKFDFQFNQASSLGIARCYVDGLLLGELLGNTATVSPSTISEIRLYTTAAGAIGDVNAIYISECQVLDVTTLGRRMATLVLTGTGATDDWTPSTGATSVATVDEAGSYADSDYAASVTADQVYTGVTSDLSSTAQQFAVDSVVIAYRALRGATGPQNLKGVVRVGGTNYPSTNNVATLPTVFGYAWADFDLNPATSAAWTPTEINTAGFETGAKSIT